jgi:ribosomal protein L37AE/L43A
LKIIGNKLTIVERYDTEEDAIIVHDKIRKNVANIHDLHRDYTDDYKIYYTKKMLEQIKKHEKDYDFVLEILASIMKICEISDMRLKLFRNGKKIKIKLCNPYITKRTKHILDDRNVWFYMFKVKCTCPYCGKVYSVNADEHYIMECEKCRNSFQVNTKDQYTAIIKKEDQVLNLN